MTPPQATEKPYRHRHWSSPDGLELHFRDYAGDAGDGSMEKGAADERGRLPVVCLHGLTRNARDFDELAAAIAATGRRVLVPEMRGRGRSAYAPDSDSYALPVYISDLKALLAQEEIERFIPIGTSMGGLMIMGLAATEADRIAGAVFNDVGPVVDAEGLEKIKGYVGQGRNFPTWVHAARALADQHGDTYPRYNLEDWLVMAKRIMVVGSSGRIVFDYDMKIAEPIMADDSTAAPVNLWPMVQALAGKPVVVVRGALSNILSEATFSEMGRMLPGSRSVTIADTGHAPTLDEPDAREAIMAMLAEAP